MQETATDLPAGGNSNNGAICGPFARNVNNDAANANWNQRGRVAICSVTCDRPYFLKNRG